MRPLPRRLVLIALLSLGGSLSVVAKPASDGQPSLAPMVTVVNAIARELVERVVVTGTLVPRDEVLVTPEVEGLRITELLVEEGAVIQQGQVLARLSRDTWRRSLPKTAPISCGLRPP